MQNKFRGELKVNLNNTEYNTRLTLDGIMRIETATGRPILKLATELMNSNLSVTDCVNILSVAIRAGGNNMTQKEIGELVFQSGLTEGLRVTGEILANTITGGKSSQEEDEDEDEEEGSEKNVEAVSNQTD